jgi:hypothetical protein
MVTGAVVANQPSDVNGISGGLIPYNAIFYAGTTVTLVATSTVNGFVFSKWIVNGVDSGTSPVTVVIMSSSKIITALYNLVPVMIGNSTTIQDITIQDAIIQ